MTLTPTQDKLLKLLADGEPHLAEQLMVGLGDEFMEHNTLKVHVSNLRGALKEVGKDIASHLIQVSTIQRVMYQIVDANWQCFTPRK